MEFLAWRRAVVERNRRAGIEVVELDMRGGSVRGMAVLNIICHRWIWRGRVIWESWDRMTSMTGKGLACRRRQIILPWPSIDSHS